jgi:acyl-CoA synthetase (AMP-forming)/AMP-acid ligase II
VTTGDTADQYTSIPAAVQDAARRWGGRLAVVDGDVRLSFTDVADEMLAVSRSLIALGIEPGDRIALWAPNSAIWIPTALGILATGAWLVPLNTRFRGDEAAYVLNKTKARVLFAPADFLGTNYFDMLDDVPDGVAMLEHRIDLPGPGSMTGEAWTEFLAHGSAVSLADAQTRLDSIGPDDVSDIIFTSGTTGHPKGVMLRHGASLEGYQILNRNYGLREGDTHLVPTPFFHCFGYKAGWMLSLINGAATVPIAVFDSTNILRLIEEEHATHIPGSPTMWWAILNDAHRAERDLSSLRVVMVSAATIPETLVHRMRDDLALETIISGYGLTENHALVSFNGPKSTPEQVVSTVGPVMDELEIRIVDDEGNDVSVGETGEILVRGFLHMNGYYDEPEATASTIVDGWLHTGDIGCIDDQRYLKITDRKKDMFIMGGFNVSPAEVERALMEFPKIGQIAVVGMPDEYFGEVGAAFVIPKEGVDLTADEVEAYARAHLANYKVPRRVTLVESFPLNATGKVLKTELRKQLKEASA